jgi:hypothetical protein
VHYKFLCIRAQRLQERQLVRRIIGQPRSCARRFHVVHTDACRAIGKGSSLECTAFTTADRAAAAWDCIGVSGGCTASPRGSGDPLSPVL